MTKVKTIVVDDEPLARARIIKLLEAYEDIQLVAECKNGKEAIKAIRDYRPALAFLDIQMPDLNGFDVLSDKTLKPLPFIIFVTAFDQYALKAFDVQAVDYLLKPYDEDRFRKAVEHACQQIQQQQQAQLHQKMMQLITSHQQEATAYLYKLEYRDKGIDKSVDIADVSHLASDGNYIRLHTGRRNIIIRQTLQSISEQLDPGLFLRIHRSLLLNINFIDKAVYEGNNQYAFIMKNGQRLISSRGYKAPIQRFLHDNPQYI
jgi:two-component system LytT family response regulator